AVREAAHRAGSSRPLVVGDRLDTDLEGARAAGIPGLLVLTGITGISELLGAAPEVRPDLVGRDLGALLEEHPAAVVDADGAGRCRAAVVRVPDGKLVVDDPGGDALDLLRAACAATWTAGGSPDPGPVLDAVRRLEPAATWAR